MDSVLRAAAVYLFLLIIVRAAGRRTLGELTIFDFILVLIISEAIQNAMMGDDYSLTNAFLVVTTLVVMDLGFTYLKMRFPRVGNWVDGVPTILIERGRPVDDRMERARVDVSDVLEAARELQGLERLEQIKYAVLERDGGITIIPMPEHERGQAPPEAKGRGKAPRKSR